VASDGAHLVLFTDSGFTPATGWLNGLPPRVPQVAYPRSLADLSGDGCEGIAA